MILHTLVVMREQSYLKAIAGVFLKLGCIGFGGPAAHIAMMETEVVKKRKWLSGDHFLDLVGATNLIPGPNSTEMAMHCGYEKGGWKGLVVAGACFITPAVIITAVFAWAYRQYGRLPAVRPFIYGIQPAIIAIIVVLMLSLGKKALKSKQLGIIGVLAAALALYGVNEIIVLFGAGAAGILMYLLRKRTGELKSVSPLFLFWLFLKIGAVLYGSGYVLFAFLDAALVDKGLLSKQQLVDAVAVGQFTPGPVFSSATFIGWQIAGWPGAIAATAGIFLPSFLFVAFLNPLIPRLRRSGVMSAFLDTVNIAAVAIILAVCVEMGKVAITDWRTTLIALSGFAVMLLFPRLNTAWVVSGGAAAGYLLSII
jgi:chromate transporter